MSMLEFEEYKGKLNTLKPALDDLQDALHLEEAKREIAELQEESAQDGFWNPLAAGAAAHQAAADQVRKVRQALLVLGRSFHHV